MTDSIQKAIFKTPHPPKKMLAHISLRSTMLMHDDGSFTVHLTVAKSLMQYPSAAGDNCTAD